MSQILQLQYIAANYVEADTNVIPCGLVELLHRRRMNENGPERLPDILSKNRDNRDLRFDGNLGKSQSVFPHDPVIVIAELSLVNSSGREAEKMTSVF